MGTIRAYYEKISFIHRYLPDQIDKIVSELGKAIVELNTEDQLFHGKDTYGDVIGTYSPLTQGLTAGMSGKGYPKRTGRPFNLYASGNLFRSIDAVFENNSIDFFTRDPGHPFFDKNPVEALKMIGLTKENAHKVNYEWILPRIRKWVMNSLK
jgi:hypothetical protein